MLVSSVVPYYQMHKMISESGIFIEHWHKGGAAFIAAKATPTLDYSRVSTIVAVQLSDQLNLKLNE